MMIGISRKAFTLVELILVIVIIGVLSALLLPTLQRSRQMSRTTACLSHLHQIGIAMQTYLTENNGTMPSLQNRNSVTNQVSAMDTVLLSNSGKSRIFKCPADRSRLFEDTGTSYFWNFTINGQDIDKLFSVAGGTDPTHIPLVSDKEGFHVELKDKVNTLYADGVVSKELKFSTSLPSP